MTKNMSCTPAGAHDARAAHDLGDDDRDCSMGSEGAERSAGSNEQCTAIGPRPTVAQVGGYCVTYLLGQR
jgi:hypothetical protein